MYQLSDRSIKALHAGTAEGNSDHIRSALARGLPEFQPALCAHDGHMVIVGSGPSLPSFVDEIMEERGKGRTICAINGAHDFLCGHGIEPDLFVSCDPRITVLSNIQKTSEKPKYLLASRCHPSLFDLKGKQVVVWHSFSSKTDAATNPPKPMMTWDDFEPDDECEVWKGRLGVGGGSTSGLRAIYLAYLMGYRRIILYGMDSCLAEDRHTKRFSGENVGTGMVVDVIVGGRRFWCNGALAKQATEFQPIINQLPGLVVDVKGDGLLAAIMSERRKREMSGWLMSA